MGRARSHGDGMHIIPFKGRNHSGPVNQNLLWRDGNVFLMDNHRAALWCWQQVLDLYEERHSILHIDRHTDCLSANLEQHLNAMPDLRDLSIQDYLAAQVQLADSSTALFRWDNYLSIHIEAFRNNLSILRSADHAEGDAPNFPATIRPLPDELPQNLYYWLQRSPAPWIVNVDLDYFFVQGPDDNEEGRWLPMFSNDYIDMIFSQLRMALDDGSAKVVTVCLTPSNFTPGWTECIKLSERIFELLDAEFPILDGG